MKKQKKKIHSFQYKNKILMISSRVIITLLIILSSIFFMMLGVTGVVPFGYFVMIVVPYYFCLGIGGFFQWYKKVKSKYKHVLNGISCMFIILVSVGIYYLSNTFAFMENIQATGFQTEDYHIVVLKDSKYQKLQDVDGLNFGISSVETENFKEACQLLKDQIKYDETFYDNVITMGEDLLSQKIEVFFISHAYLDIIEEEDDLFESKIRILDTISVEVKHDVEKKEIDVTEKPFTLYVSGIDVYGKISSVARSDVNMLITVNPSTYEVLLTSIPRDYYVQLHGTTGRKDKLTHSGIYGINSSVQTLEDLLEVDINYYVRVNFTTLIQLVDALGGIDVESDYAFTSTYSGIRFQKGSNHLNGEQALAFARERYSFRDGDRQRVRNQQIVISAIIKKVTSSSALVTKYSAILKTLGNSFQTNMDQDRIYSFVNYQLEKMPSWHIQTISLEGRDSYNYTYSYGAQQLYVMEPDKDSIERAIQKINEITDGKVENREDENVGEE